MESSHKSSKSCVSKATNKSDLNLIPMKMFQKSSSSFKSVSLMPSLATKNKNPIASIKKSDIKTTYNEQTKIHTRIKPH